MKLTKNGFAILPIDAMPAVEVAVVEAMEVA